MKLIEKLYKVTMDVKRAIELPLVVRQTERLLDDKVREFAAANEDAELDLKRLYTEFAEADKSSKGSVFNRIVEKKIEIEEAGKIAEVAKAVKSELFAEVGE
jgi:hypothetical protein